MQDPVLNQVILDTYAKAYAGDNDPANPLISPLLADLRDLPPINIQAGEHEILLEQSKQFEEKARQAGVEIRLDCWPGMFHVFQMVPILPESRRSLEKNRRVSGWKNRPDSLTCQVRTSTAELHPSRPLETIPSAN